MNGLEREQRIFSWGGLEYPQDTVIYRWGCHVELVPGGVQPYVLGLFPEGLIGPEWVSFAIEGDGLYLLESEINGFEMDWGDKRLDDFLALLLNQHDQWAVVFELYSDQIDNVYELTVDECVRKLKANLKRDVKREGFIAFPSSV